jgi:hypothetical protein
MAREDAPIGVMASVLANLGFGIVDDDCQVVHAACKASTGEEA